MEQEQLIDPNKDLKNALGLLQQQIEYLITANDKLTERFNGMGRAMVDGNKAITTKIDDSIRPQVGRYACFFHEPMCSDQTGELAAAMAKAMAAFGAIIKGGTANRSKFATIEDMLEITLPILDELGIAANFFELGNEHGDLALKLRVTHSSGQWWQTIAPMHVEKVPDNISVYHQKINAAEKYLRRSMYRSMFNLAEGD